MQQHTPSHIHDDLQEVISRDTDISHAISLGGAAAFKTNLNRRFGTYRLVRDARSAQQNLARRLNAAAAAQKGSPGFKPETPVGAIVSFGSSLLIFTSMLTNACTSLNLDYRKFGGNNMFIL